MKKTTASLFLLILLLASAGCQSLFYAGPFDKIPMVMVDGTLYLDTGSLSTEQDRSEVLDGKITSEVDGSETPQADNQSNFGIGYGWQYGGTEGTIEVFMNQNWHIFTTEEVRAELQSPTK